MKRAALILPALVAGAMLVLNLSPRAGAKAFTLAATSEAAAYGLHAQTADLGELRMAFYDGGPKAAAEAIVMLHGYSADKQVWPRFARPLLEKYRVIIPDLAGHGESGFNPAWNYSGPAQARRVALLMDKLGIQKAHIVGNSMGGFIAAHFALATPERTLSAGLIDPHGVASPQPSDMEKMLAAGKNPFEVHSPAEFDRFYAMTMAQPPWLPRFMLSAMAADYMARREQLAVIFKGFHDSDALDSHLAGIKVPTLLLWGSKDRLIDVSSAKVWAAGLPNARLVIEDGIGHMPMVEEPAKAAQIYQSFLSSLQK